MWRCPKIGVPQVSMGENGRILDDLDLGTAIVGTPIHILI